MASSPTLDAARAQTEIQNAKERLAVGKSRLLNTFACVPDDKLTYSPTETSKSSLALAAHCGISNGAFIRLMLRQPMPPMSREEMSAYARAEEAKYTTREEVVRLIEESCAEVERTLDSLTPEDVAAVVENPIMTAPVTFFMGLPGRHMDNHAAQIDYIQTCWGDMEWHF